jgi:hypothetical protein
MLHLLKHSTIFDKTTNSGENAILKMRALIILMMEAIISSETSVSIYQITWYDIPEDSDLHTQ